MYFILSYVGMIDFENGEASDNIKNLTTAWNDPVHLLYWPRKRGHFLTPFGLFFYHNIWLFRMTTENVVKMTPVVVGA